MSDHSAISWTDATWSPVLGCSRVSAGCDACYAIRSVHRLAGNPNPKIGPAYAGLTARRGGRLDWTGVVRLVPARLDLPLLWKRPRRVFVNSQSDLFHPSLSFADIDRVFAVMAVTPEHTYQILTKRPERARAYLAAALTTTQAVRCIEVGRDGDQVFANDAVLPWPLPNVWLGTSCEDQAVADERLPWLATTPAAVRFVSLEPLLGPIDLARWLTCCPSCGTPRPERYADTCGYCQAGAWQPPLTWVIVGGESGPGFRPMQLDWLVGIVDQCRAAGVAVWVKQDAACRSGQQGRIPAASWVQQFPAAVPA